jgi:hypothetical protein
MIDEDRTQRLTLELEVGVEPLSGVLAGEGFSWRFEGWLALAAALERARGLRPPRRETCP